MKIIAGIETGGSHITCVLADQTGRIIKQRTVRIAGNQYHNSDVGMSIQKALKATVSYAGLRLCDLSVVVAGLSGIDRPADWQRAQKIFSALGLKCKVITVNDTEITQRAVFGTAPGIIAISGTGSNIWARTDSGRKLSCFDVGYYAYSAARFLVKDLLYLLMAGRGGLKDKRLIGDIKRYWRIEDLAQIVDKLWLITSTPISLRKKLGKMAPMVTRAAERGMPLPRLVCRRMTENVAIGVEMLGNLFKSKVVKYSIVGSLGNSPFVLSCLKRRMRKASGGKKYIYIRPALSPVMGAIDMGRAIIKGL